MSAGMPPLLMVGHGTRSAEGAAQFQRLVERVRARDGGRLPGVGGGFIELAGPSVAQAMERLAGTPGLAPPATGQGPDGGGAAGGARRGGVEQAGAADWLVVAVPLVLSAAGHGKGDIPAALARERARHPGLRYRYGRPLGPHPALLDVMQERIGAALAGAGRTETHVLLVGRGSTDPDANAEHAKVARLLWEGRGYADVLPAFVSLAGPSVPAALDRARALGARRVVVAPYFLFDGVLPDRVAAQAREFAGAHPQIDVRTAGLIGDCDELADLVLERYREACHGDIRMNCDTCAYRVALPGFAGKVGQPQTPHHHPDDPGHHHGDAQHAGDPGRRPGDPGHGPGRFHGADGHSHVGPGHARNQPDRDHGERHAAPGGPAQALGHHGDAELAPGLTDLAVNVWHAAPGWLRREMAASLDGLAAYPEPGPAQRAVAARHGRPPEEALLTAGAAEAFVLLARALAPACAVVVHPQFTEPEAALRAAGRPVRRVLLSPDDGFALAGAAVPPEADLVVVGNPTNPTSVLHPAAALRALARPGRVLVVDEAFMDAVPGETESLAGSRDLPGLLVVRSLTKAWGLAGLRVGYVLGPPALLARLRAAQPLWAVSSPALAAALACVSPRAAAESRAAAWEAERRRGHLLRRLEEIPGVAVAGRPRAPFALLHIPGRPGVREALRREGFAARRGDTFPGLGPDWLRVAVRDPATSDAFANALSEVMSR